MRESKRANYRERDKQEEFEHTQEEREGLGEAEEGSAADGVVKEGIFCAL